MRRVLLGSVTLLALVLPATLSARPVQRPTDVDVADDETADRRGVEDGIFVSTLRVHEWGVWQLDAQSRVRSLEQVASESPAFVHRVAQANPPSPELGPVPLPDYGPQVFDKPVVFLYAEQPTEVSFTVRVPNGRPWLYYPDATLGRVRGANAVRFTGRVLASEPMPEGVRFPEPPQGHWWTLLRNVNASPFVSAGNREAERFLFYDGQARFPRGFSHRRGAITPSGANVDALAWTIESQAATRLAITGRSVSRTPLASVAILYAELRARLIARGLSAAESDSLLNTWRTELFARPGKRVIWLLTPQAYEAMLPVEISPPPRELVRVGVVIEQY
jgi:hypothetical protein